MFQALRASVLRNGLTRGRYVQPLAKSFSISGLAALKQMPPRPKPPPDSEIEESYLKGSGPGGQKINKTSSAVQLKHIPTGIVVKSQATRSQSQNRKIAREILAAKIDDLLNGDQSRSAIVGEVKRRRAASAAKKSRRKHRKATDDVMASCSVPSGAFGKVEVETQTRDGDNDSTQASTSYSR